MSINIAYAGDIMLSAPSPEKFFAPSAEIFRQAEVSVGQLEWPHTARGQVCVVDIPAPACPPEYLDAVKDAGFDVMTMASNHMFDQGPNGIRDARHALSSRSIESVGAGMTLEEARTPAIIERGGVKIGFLSYNAVGPRESWATTLKAGVAPVRVINHYELDIASPGSAPAEFTSLDPDSLAAMTADIEDLRSKVDVVSVSLHKGMGFIRAKLALYERPLAHAAVDAGADVVIGHHAHILRGVEVYRGRPIYHGINHFIPAYTASSDPLGHHRPRPANAPSLDFFSPDPGRAPFPFPAESRHTVIARVEVDVKGVVSAGFVPCQIDTDAIPHPVAGDAGAAVVDYMSAISSEAGLCPDIRGRDGEAVFFVRGQE